MPDHLDQLLRRKRLLEERLAKIVAAQNAPHSHDFEDQAQERENDEVLEGLECCSLDDLFNVRKAIQRYETGTYGICTRCGEKISENRLDVLPEAAECQRCASKDI